MDEQNMAANAVDVTEAVAEPTPTTAEPNTTTPETTPQPTETQAFSRRLNESKAEWERQHAADMDALIAEVYGGQYKTVAEYKAAAEQQRLQDEAAQRGIDPALYEQMTAAERKAAEAEAKATEAMSALNAYHRREELAKEAATVAADARFGPFFTANRDEIMRVAGEIDGSGMTPQTHLDVALMYVLKDKWQPTDEKAIRETAVKEYLADLKRKNAPVESGNTTPVVQTVTGKDPWDTAFRGSMEYLKSVKQKE